MQSLGKVVNKKLFKKTVDTIPAYFLVILIMYVHLDRKFRPINRYLNK